MAEIGGDCRDEGVGERMEGRGGRGGCVCVRVAPPPGVCVWGGRGALFGGEMGSYNHPEGGRHQQLPAHGLRAGYSVCALQAPCS